VKKRGLNSYELRRNLCNILKLNPTAKLLYSLLISLRIWKSSSLFSACWRKVGRWTSLHPGMKEITGENDYVLKPDKTIDEIDPDEYDLLIIPGGAPNGAPATVRKIKKAQEIAKSFFAKNKPVASICHGPYTLVSAGLVKGRHLTSFWHDGVPEEIQGAGGIWEDKDVVVDGNLVTSRWPMDLPAFMREIMRMAKTV
jgi:protease I